MNVNDIKIQIGDKKYKMVENHSKTTDCDLCDFNNMCFLNESFKPCLDGAYLVREGYKRIYISGQIAGFDRNERRKAFYEKEMYLRKSGYEVLNPFNNGVDEDSSRYDHMRADIKMLLRCDAIYMMKGWKDSRGAVTEHTVAVECGLEVIYEDADKQ